MHNIKILRICFYWFFNAKIPFNLPQFGPPKFLHFRQKIKNRNKKNVMLPNRFPWYVMNPKHQNAQTRLVFFQTRYLVVGQTDAHFAKARFFLHWNLYLSLHCISLFGSLTHSLCSWRIIVYPVMKSSSSESFLSLIFVLTEAWTNRPGIFLLSIYSATYLLNVWFYPPSYYQLLTLEATTFSVFSKRVFKIWKF